ncbi:pentatricopeptide repeat-containing protein At3g09040, mitochondrial-like [Selaginella moellendorffii]|uniref:pentatricopeptide repeat-containing protein At3g09040, mitochondrial-like n=1 Tax=Selaginella moellendorffii TaxID=88036 RepID=UPI000D1CC7A1|nr:pentatricopeptide repeat-containing protein At3g09040, mitochondrial-like [Selaginella moellendorffii]|eukprot:XP_024541839.1 pentatricopeptide repeat-containing protein At3g09040, mitochondrial-like [Selaginella moellendorffii]
MYARCGSTADARSVFDRLPCHDTASWNSLMLGYAENGQGELVLDDFFSRLHGQGRAFDGRSFVAALKACSSIAAREESTPSIHGNGKFVKARALENVKSVHSKALLGAYCSLNVIVFNTLVDSYARCGSMPDARRVFERMPCHSIVSWNSLLLGYVEVGDQDQALDLFQWMIETGSCKPEARTFGAVFKACGSLAVKNGDSLSGRWLTLEKGRALHLEAVTRACELDDFALNALVDMYAKCGSVEDAQGVFDSMPARDIVSWTALLMAYTESGQEGRALELLSRMEIEPDAQTYAAAAKACTGLAVKEQGVDVSGKLVKLRALDKGMAVHSRAARSGCDTDVFVASVLITMYGKCGSPVDSRKVFERMQSPDIVSWTGLLSAHVENGEAEAALAMFFRMQQGGEERGRRNSPAFIQALNACCALAAKEEAVESDGAVVKVGALDMGVAIHSLAKASGCDQDTLVANGLIDMYSKCGSLASAHRVFEVIPARNLQSWNKLMLGCVANREADLTLDVFARMQTQGGFTPDAQSYVAALKAWSRLAANEEKNPEGLKTSSLEKGRALHRQTGKKLGDIYLAGTLVEFYSKCGSTEDAQQIFDRVPCFDAGLCNALMLGYTENDKPDSALELFKQLPAQASLDCLTYLAALKASTRLAIKGEPRVVNGRRVIKAEALEGGMAVHARMIADGVSWDRELSLGNSLVDMYAKCGSLVDSRQAFDRMARHSVVSWTSLILGCSENGDEALALELFARGGFAVDAASLTAALKSCGSLVDVELGRRAHSQACRAGLESDGAVTSSLVDMYGKCGSSSSSQHVFDSMAARSTAAWNSLLGAYSRVGEIGQVLESFGKMREEGFPADGITCLCLLTAYNHCGRVEQGKRFFDSMSCWGVEHVHCVIDMLARADSEAMEAAVELASSLALSEDGDAITWRILLAGCERWKNVEVGDVVFERLVAKGQDDAFAYALIAKLHRS